jgi:hypothetical protein
MSEQRMSIREVLFLGMLAGKHTRHTAADAAGITGAEAVRVATRLGLRFDDADRARDGFHLARILADELRVVVTAVLAAGARRRPRDTGPSATKAGLDPALVREWARANGWPCSDRGRFTRALLDAYSAAHPGGDS